MPAWASARELGLEPIRWVHFGTSTGYTVLPAHVLLCWVPRKCAQCAIRLSEWVLDLHQIHETPNRRTSVVQAFFARRRDRLFWRACDRLPRWLSDDVSVGIFAATFGRLSE